MSVPAEAAKKPALKIVQSKAKSIGETLDGLKSKELVVGLSGPLGCGLKALGELFEASLEDIGYTVVKI
jgi:hypothetical protein